MKIVLNNKQQIYFTSDSHYGHKNICRGVSTWNLNDHGGHSSVRDFDTLEDMNNTILNAINSVVKEDDILIHLGDVAFGGIENIWKFRKQIKCKNIHLILGNHDEHILKGNFFDLENNVQNRIDYVSLTKNKADFFPGSEGILKGRVNKLFDSVNQLMTLRVSCSRLGKNTFELCHFPLKTWNKGHHGRIHLHGHCHGNLSNIHNERFLDIGIDSRFKIFKDYKPFSLPEILEIMKDKKYRTIDHHNKDIN